MDKKIKEKATKIFLDHHGFIRLIAFDYAPSSDLAGDVVNEVFLFFTENADRWDLNGEIRPLLRQITRRIALEQWRNYKKQLPDELEKIFDYIQKDLSTRSDHDDSVDLNSRLLALDICREKLLPKYRTLLEAHYFSGLKLVQIAKNRNINIGTLKKTMCRIRETLYRCIEKILKKEDHDAE